MSSLPKKIKVGDHFMDYGHAYTVFQVKTKSDSKGGEESIVYYKPHFSNHRNETVVRSIPMKNIPKTDKRLPLTKSEIKDLLTLLSQPKKRGGRINIQSARTTLKHNDPQETAKLVKTLWLEKESPDKNFTFTKEELYELGLKQLSEEIALVYEQDLSKAKQKLIRALKKSTE